MIIEGWYIQAVDPFKKWAVSQRVFDPPKKTYADDVLAGLILKTVVEQMTERALDEGMDISVTQWNGAIFYEEWRDDV